MIVTNTIDELKEMLNVKLPADASDKPIALKAWTFFCEFLDMCDDTLCCDYLLFYLHRWYY